MAQYTIDASSVSWTNYASLTGSGQGAQRSFTLTTNSPQIDTTASSGSSVLSRSFLSDLYTTTISMEGRMDPAVLGSSFAATWGNVNSANVKSVVYNLNWPTNNTTVAASTHAADGAGMTYLPGLMTWTADVVMGIDDTTDAPLAGGAGGSLVTTVTDADGDTLILTGSAAVTGTPVPIELGSVPQLSVSGQGSGNLAVSGTEADTFLDDLISSGNLYNPGAGEFTGTAASGRTFIVDAFITSLVIRMEIGGALTYTATAQGTGDLTGTAIS